MTTSTAMDINTFCPLPIWIPTVKDDDQEAWFLLNTHIHAGLELPEGFDHEEFLDLEEWSRTLLEYANGKKEELHLVSESGLYKLILLSDAKMFSSFKGWVMQVVAPTLAEDGLYELGEESKYPAPSGYDLTHADIWDEGASDFGSARDLATRYLPELRRYGSVDDIRFIDEHGELKLSLYDVSFACHKKIKRKGPGKAIRLNRQP